MKKKTLYGLIIILIIIQFFRIDKTNPVVNSADDFIELTNPPKEIATILVSSCYDCHSNESSYPWYSNISPVSWWVKHHINEAREELNFSKWSTYNEKKKDHKLEEMIAEVEEGEMPLKPYPLTHPEARLDAIQKAELLNWFKKTRQDAKEKKNKHKLTLNNGDKWVSDDATNNAIAKMIELANEKIEEGNITLYQEMGKNLSAEMQGLFKVCTMKGAAHDQLHNFILPLVKMYRNLKEEENNEEASIQQKEIKAYLTSYDTFGEF
ncbi:MAG: heme-binding domain-containing protein [Flavobacteriales bacterium]